MSETLSEAIKSVVWHELSGKVHTTLPATIVSYDSVNMLCVVRPSIGKKYSDGSELIYGEIYDVPVIFQRTSRFHMSYPLEEGDGVLLLFCEREIQTWSTSKTVPIIPETTHRFDLMDAFALPGLFQAGKGSKVSDPKKIEISFDDVSIVSDGKDFTITNSQASIVSKGSRITLDGGNAPVLPQAGCITGQSVDPFTGLPHIDFSSKIRVEK